MWATIPCGQTGGQHRAPHFSGPVPRSVLILLACAALAACSQRDKKPRLAQSRIVGTWRGGRVTLTLTTDGMARRIDSMPVGVAEFAGTWDGADSLLRLVLHAADPARPRTESHLFIIHPDTLIRSNDANERLTRRSQQR
jgi:hypothetical protein